MDDEPLVAAVLAEAAAGSEEAWDSLVDRYAPLVLSVVRRHRLSGEDAHDVFQTVWLRLVEHLGSLREPEALPGWLATTTRNECLRVLRGHQRSTPLDPTTMDESARMATTDDPAAGLLAAERHEALLAAFAELPDQQRRLLALLLHDPPLAYAEIAERLGVSIGYIGPTRSRALDRLRKSAPLAALGGDAAHMGNGGGSHGDA